MSLLYFAPQTEAHARQGWNWALSCLGVAVLLVSPDQSFSDSKAGCELTLTRPSLVRATQYDANDSQMRSNAHSAQLRADLFAKVQQTCTECRFDTIPYRDLPDYTSYRVTYPDGWWFLISFDPGVIEIQCKPFESAFHEEFIRRMNRDLFVPARSAPLSLKADSDVGMGHVNLDFSTTFGGDVRRLKDFLADLLNHPAIGTGIIGHDTGTGYEGVSNAIHPASDPNLWKGLDEVFNQVETGAITSIASFQNSLYSRAFSSRKFNFFNIHSRNGVFYLELRFPYAQDTANEFIELIRIFEKRIALIKARNIPIALMPRPGQMTSRQKVEQFLDYTSQASVPFESAAYFIAKAFREGLKRTGYRNYTPQSFEAALKARGQNISQREVISEPLPPKDSFSRFCSALAGPIESLFRQFR